MARKKGTPTGETSRNENNKFNDLRFTSGVEGVAAKEERKTKKWMENVRENTFSKDEGKKKYKK
jgi:hypothetical protein